MRKSSYSKIRRSKYQPYSQDSNQSDEDNGLRLTSRKCSSNSSSSLNKYEKQIMQRGYSTDKRQSPRKKLDSSVKDHQLPSRRSRTRSKVPHVLKRKSPHESDSYYQYALPPSPKPSVENIPKSAAASAALGRYKYDPEDHKKLYKDSEDENDRYRREAATARYLRNIDENLNYNRFNPNHNIHKNLSVNKKHASFVRSRTGSNNLLSLQEYNRMLQNDSQNSYGYFHGDKNNKLCYISNRPVYYDNSSINETIRYRQQYNELSIKNNSEFRMMSKSDTSLTQPMKYYQNYQSDGNIDSKVGYLNGEKVAKKSHHNEKSLLDINPDSPNEGAPIKDKNSEITRLTNEIAKKLQNIGLNIHSTAEPPARSKSKRKKENTSDNSLSKNINNKETSSSKEDGFNNAGDKDRRQSMSCLRPDPDEMGPESELRRPSEQSRAMKQSSKYKRHSKYYLSNAEMTDENCLCRDSYTNKQKDGSNGCCYRDGDHINLKQDMLNCCNSRLDSSRYENLDLYDLQRMCQQPEDGLGIVHHSKMLSFNKPKLPSCTCAFKETKCECNPEIVPKYSLYKNKRSRSPLTAVNKKTNGVYVFVPLPENSNDPLEMSKHLQNIYNNIIPLNDKQDKKSSSNTQIEATPKKNMQSEQPTEKNKQPEHPKPPVEEPPKEVSIKETTEKIIRGEAEKENFENESETAKVKLINQLLDEYNISLIKQLIRKKSPLKPFSSRENIIDDKLLKHKQSVSRRHSDLNLNLDQLAKTAYKTKKCPSENSFIMKLAGKRGADVRANDPERSSYFHENRFNLSPPDHTSAFQQLQQQLQQQHPMLFENREPLNNYQQINLPFTEFVSDLAKYHPQPQNAQSLFYSRTKSPKSYHGASPPAQSHLESTTKQPVAQNVPLASTIIDPALQFQSKANNEVTRDTPAAYSPPKPPHQNFQSYGVDIPSKNHDHLLHHMQYHHQSTLNKLGYDPPPDPANYGKVQNMSSYYPGDQNFSLQPQIHSAVYDELQNDPMGYSPTRFDFSPSRFEPLSMYDQDYNSHQHQHSHSHQHDHKSFKSQYYKSGEPANFCFDSTGDSMAYQSHSFQQPYHKMEPHIHGHNHSHFHGDRSSQFVEFQEKVHYIESDDQPKSSILKKLQDVVAKPFSLLFKVETSNSSQNKSPHLKGILKPPIDVEEDESNDCCYYKKCPGGGAGGGSGNTNGSYEKNQTKTTQNSYDELDLDGISQPPLEYVTVVDPYQTDSFESIHDEEKRYTANSATTSASADSSTIRNVKGSSQGP